MASKPRTSEQVEVACDIRHGETLPAEPLPRSIRECRCGDPPDRWLTNIDRTTERGVSLLLNAMNPPTLTLDVVGQLRMRLCHYVACVAEAEDRETGEISEAPKTVLIDQQGRSFVTRSRWAPDKMLNLAAVFPPARWAEGIPILIREHRSARTKQTSHVIEIDLSPES